MADGVVQSRSVNADGATSVSLAFSSDITSGNRIVVCVTRYAISGDAAIELGDCAKSAGSATIGSFTLDGPNAHNTTTGSEAMNVAIFSAAVTGTGSCTITVSGDPINDYWNLTLIELHADGGAITVEDSASATGETGAASSGDGSSAGKAFFIGGMSCYVSSSTTITEDEAFTLIYKEEDGSAHNVCSFIERLVTGATTDSASWTAPTTVQWVATLAVYAVPASGTQYNQSVSGGMTPGGTVVNAARKVLTGEITPGGGLVNAARKILSGALAAAGDLAAQLIGGGTQYEQAVSGGMTPSGTVANLTSKIVAGGLTPDGAVVRRAGKSLAGELTPAGPGSWIRDVFINLSGAVAPDGTVSKRAGKVLAGELTSSGVVGTIKAALMSLAGELAPAGALVLQAGKSLAGALAPDGALARAGRKILDGGITPDGTVSKRAGKVLAGELTSSGVVATIKAALVSLAGELAPAGALAVQAGKSLAGALAPEGGLVRQIGKGLAGALAPEGGLVKRIGKILAGALGADGLLAAVKNAVVAAVPGRAVVSDAGWGAASVTEAQIGAAAVEDEDNG